MHRATPLNTSFRAFSAGGARSAVDTITDTTLMQEMAGNFMNGEARKAIEAPQNYGFTSVVMPAIKDALGKITDSAEAVINFMGGSRSFPVASVMDDRRHRLNGLQPGDVAMFRTATDFLQMHLNAAGMFMTAPRDKTVRMQMLDQDSGQQQQSSSAQPGQHDASSSGTSGSSSSPSSSGQQQKGQKSVYQKGQQSYRFHDITKDETRSSGTTVRSYLSDGQCYVDVFSDKKVYLGARNDMGKFDFVVTVSGPCKNVKGLLGQT